MHDLCIPIIYASACARMVDRFHLESESQRCPCSVSRFTESSHPPVWVANAWRFADLDARWQVKFASRVNLTFVDQSTGVVEARGVPVLANWNRGCNLERLLQVSPCLCCQVLFRSSNPFRLHGGCCLCMLDMIMLGVTRARLGCSGRSCAARW